jgi:6-pyruvoyltetrahydropterin/6-carboxytetrahydropterin synthase
MTQILRVTKTFTFDMAHALYGYDGPCKNIHGHTYKLSVTLKGKALENPESPKNGMLIDFTEFKKLVNTEVIDVYDHSLVLNLDSPHSKISGLNENFEKIHYVTFQPTCENLLLDMCSKIKKVLPNHLQLKNMKLEETPSSYAEWFMDDN